MCDSRNLFGPGMICTKTQMTQGEIIKGKFTVFTVALNKHKIAIEKMHWNLISTQPFVFAARPFAGAPQELEAVEQQARENRLSKSLHLLEQAKEEELAAREVVRAQEAEAQTATFAQQQAALMATEVRSFF